MAILDDAALVLIAPLSGSMLVLVLAGLLGISRLSQTWKRLAKCAQALAVLWLWSWSTPLASDALRGWLESQAGPRQMADVATAEFGVVLGGGVSGPRLPDRPDPDLTASADRLWYAARLFHAGKVNRLVLTGGVVRTGDGAEAESMRRVLVDLGVPERAMLLEGASTSTNTNAARVAELLGLSEAPEVVLITSALHMPRARATFERAGFKVIAAPTDFEVVHQDIGIGRLLPDAAALHGSTRAIKELVGWWWVRR